jgi:uncharacterized membrane protein
MKIQSRVMFAAGCLAVAWLCWTSAAMAQGGRRGATRPSPGRVGMPACGSCCQPCGQYTNRNYPGGVYPGGTYPASIPGGYGVSYPAFVAPYALAMQAMSQSYLAQRAAPMDDSLPGYDYPVEQPIDADALMNSLAVPSDPRSSLTGHLAAAVTLGKMELPDAVKLAELTSDVVNTASKSALKDIRAKLSSLKKSGKLDGGDFQTISDDVDAVLRLGGSSLTTRK